MVFGFLFSLTIFLEFISQIHFSPKFVLYLHDSVIMIVHIEHSLDKEDVVSIERVDSFY